MEREEKRLAEEMGARSEAQGRGGAKGRSEAESGGRREARTMGEFYAHGRDTGGGSPLYPPPENDIDFIPIDFGWEDDENDNDVNHIPISLPQHLQVMGPPTEANMSIINGPFMLQSNGQNSLLNNLLSNRSSNIILQDQGSTAAPSLSLFHF